MKKAQRLVLKGIWSSKRTSSTSLHEEFTFRRVQSGTPVVDHLGAQTLLYELFHNFIHVYMREKKFSKTRFERCCLQ
jgi:hypothetical protein